MKTLLDTNITDFFEYLEQIKLCYDECSEDITKYFSYISSRYDEYELYACEEIRSFYAYCGDYPLYYDYDDTPEEDREWAGEACVFYSDEMLEFYKTLRNLKKNKIIKKKEYENWLMSAEGKIREYICSTQGYSYGGLYCELSYAKGRKHEKITVYLDYNCCFNWFSLYCGVIMLFDYYKTVLKKLKNMYLKDEAEEMKCE